MIGDYLNPQTARLMALYRLPSHMGDLLSLISARKLRIWITEPPKSRCTCKKGKA